MKIQLNKIWLFETTLTNPYFIGTEQGISLQLKDENTLELIDIETIKFYFDSRANSGLIVNTKHKGEDVGLVTAKGKRQKKYTLSISLPLDGNIDPDLIIGNDYSLIAEKADKERIIIFGQFTSNSFTQNNERRQTITLTSQNPYASIFSVSGFNYNSIEYVTEYDKVTDSVGFDYENDFLIN